MPKNARISRIIHYITRQYGYGSGTIWPKFPGYKYPRLNTIVSGLRTPKSLAHRLIDQCNPVAFELVQ